MTRFGITTMVVVALCVVSPAHPAPARSGCKVTAARGPAACGVKPAGKIEISSEAGLGRIEIAGKIGAVLSRDEGAVTLLDVSKKGKPVALGSYDDDIQDSFDGDLVFSDDGRWLFYARQTHQFSKDGLHILNVSDPESPSLAFYEPAGGAFRVAYYEDDGTGYVYILDAVAGLVVYRFEPTAGLVAPVQIDALPALKVGGPASAGIVIDRKDPLTGAPLMYVATGRTGLQVFDISDPANPLEIGSWPDVGLAEIEVDATKRKRLVYAAPEYWFNKNLPSEVIVLDATSPEAIEETARYSVPGLPETDPLDTLRIQGMTLDGGVLYVAHSSLGLVGFSTGRGGGSIVRALRDPAPRNERAAVAGAPYAMDVEVAGRIVYLTDAATGFLTTAR